MGEGSQAALKARSRVRDGIDGPSLIRLLGPVDVVSRGEPIRIGSARARTLLAALAAHAGQMLSTEALTAALWGQAPPKSATHALHVHISTLRKALPSDLPLVVGTRGYTLQVGPGRLDTDRFEELAARGRAELATGQAGDAAVLFREALSLWRGAALVDVPWDRFAEADVRRWEELRSTIEEDLVDAELAAGRHTETIADLERLVREHPLRERRWGQLIVALYRSDRQADALGRYGELRDLLADELGVDPSPELRALESSILRHDDALAPPEAHHELPATRFAAGPSARIAYQVLGKGPSNLVCLPGFGGNLEIRWEEPRLSSFYRRLAQSSRLALLDKRGTGLSDRSAGIPGYEEQIEDVIAVMDAAGFERAAILGINDGGLIALLTAAQHSDRVSGVVVYDTFVAWETLGPMAPSIFEALRAQLEHGFILELAIPMLAPSRAGDSTFVQWMGRYMRMSVGIDGAAALMDAARRADIRDILPTIRVPVLAIHREGDVLIPSENARYIAEHTPDGRCVILPGGDAILWAGDVDEIAEQVEEFVDALSAR